jgi:hypothetical protein
VLVGAAALSVVQLVDAEDITRICLARAFTSGQVTGDHCFRSSGEALYHGHRYANVPPGVSALAIPVEEAASVPAPSRSSARAGLRLWAVRLWTSGIAFLVCAFLVGRVAEGLQPGWGGAALVTFALGTLASGVAPSTFDHLPVAALTFGAFLLAWGRRPLAAGLAAGLALPFEYQAALLAAAIGAYVLRVDGLRAAARYTAGLVPGSALIAAYDQIAFGSPLRTSYLYNPTQSKAGFVGVQFPSLHGLQHVLVGERGLLVDSPVLIAAAVGLAALWRRGLRAEALVCAAVAVALVALDGGYYLPYGGGSPGPRFVVPALPFLALGLAPAFARRRGTTAVLAAASVVASTAVALTWPSIDATVGYRGSVWRQLAYLVHGPSAAIATWTQQNILQHAGIGRLGAAAAVIAVALAALAIALRDGWTAHTPARLRSQYVGAGHPGRSR